MTIKHINKIQKETSKKAWEMLDELDWSSVINEVFQLLCFGERMQARQKIITAMLRELATCDPLWSNHLKMSIKDRCIGLAGNLLTGARILEVLADKIIERGKDL